MQQLATLARDSRALAALAVPLALTQLAQVALTTTDTIMMGVLGTEALAAGGLALVVFNQLRTMGVGLVTSVGNQVAAAAARAERDEDTADDGDEVRGLVRAAMAVATLAGLAGAVLMVLIGQAATWLGQDADVAHRAQGMLAALAPGLVPCLWFQAIRQFTVGMRRPQALLQITIASVAINAGLNWLFIHGTWGLPKLGLTGIGVATSSVYLLSFLALYASARRDPQLAPLLSPDFWRADAPTVRRLLGLGTPIAATYGSEAGFFSVTALLAGSFGAAALAAHTAVNQLIYIVFQVAVGLPTRPPSTSAANSPSASTPRPAGSRTPHSPAAPPSPPSSASPTSPCPTSSCGPTSTPARPPTSRACGSPPGSWPSSPCCSSSTAPRTSASACCAASTTPGAASASP